MRKLVNTYGVMEEYDTLRIESTKYPPVTILFDAQFNAKLRLFSWCYEQSKGQVFTFDFKTGMAKKLGSVGYKFYLAKYIAYLHTGSTTVEWKRKNLLDYRVNHGVMRIINPVIVAAKVTLY